MTPSGRGVRTRRSPARPAIAPAGVGSGVGNGRRWICAAMLLLNAPPLVAPLTPTTPAPVSDVPTTPAAAVDVPTTPEAVVDAPNTPGNAVDVPKTPAPAPPKPATPISATVASDGTGAVPATPTTPGPAIVVVVPEGVAMPPMPRTPGPALTGPTVVPPKGLGPSPPKPTTPTFSVAARSACDMSAAGGRCLPPAIPTTPGPFPVPVGLPPVGNNEAPP
jgi:transcription initiation factor TFIID subunit 2